MARYKICEDAIFWGKSWQASSRRAGPSTVWDDGYVLFEKAGLLNRTSGPAFISPTGSLKFMVNGKLHRTNGPAMIGADYSQYFIHGKEINRLVAFATYGKL